MVGPLPSSYRQSIAWISDARGNLRQICRDLTSALRWRTRVLKFFMPSTLRVARLVLRLDWQLVSGTVRETPAPAVVLPAALGVLLLSSLCQSSIRTGQAVADGALAPSVATMVLVGTYVWLTFLATGVLTLAAGSVSAGERVLSDLQRHPVTRLQAFLALQILSVAGRHALVMLLVSLPLMCLLWDWLPQERLLATIAAWWVALRMVPSALRVVGRVANHLGQRTLIFVSVVALVAALALNSIVELRNVLSVLPPGLVQLVLVGANDGVDPWPLLLGWTVLIGALELAGLSREMSVAPKTPRQPIGDLPRWIVVYARTCRTLPALVQGEITRLARWRRFELSLAVVGCGMLFLAPRLPTGALTPTLLFALLPPLSVTSTLGNLFAADRSAVQAYYLLPLDPRLAVRAKLAAVGAYVIVLESAGWILLLASQGRTPQLLDLYILLMAAACYTWMATIGRTVSVLFPSPTDPHSIGGGLGNTQTVLTVLLAAALFTMPVLGAAFLYDARQISGLTLTFVATSVIVLTAVVKRLISGTSDRLFLIRREELIAAVRSGGLA